MTVTCRLDLFPLISAEAQPSTAGGTFNHRLDKRLVDSSKIFPDPPAETTRQPREQLY